MSSAISMPTLAGLRARVASWRKSSSVPSRHASRPCGRRRLAPIAHGLPGSSARRPAHCCWDHLRSLVRRWDGSAADTARRSPLRRLPADAPRHRQRCRAWRRQCGPPSAETTRTSSKNARAQRSTFTRAAARGAAHALAGRHGGAPADAMAFASPGPRRSSRSRTGSASGAAQSRRRLASASVARLRCRAARRAPCRRRRPPMSWPAANLFLKSRCQKAQVVDPRAHGKFVAAEPVSTVKAACQRSLPRRRISALPCHCASLSCRYSSDAATASWPSMKMSAYDLHLFARRRRRRDTCPPYRSAA